MNCMEPCQLLDLPDRPKRFASVAIPAIAGLVTLAVESVSGYLQNRRNKAMAKAMDALHSAHRGLSNRLYI